MRAGYFSSLKKFFAIRSRTRFFVRYILAKSRSKALLRLLPLIENSFRHPWVAEVQLQFRFWPAHGLVGQSFMSWDAPVAISIFRRKKGKKRPALSMSLYVNRDTLCIQQLQGVSRTDVPRDLEAWPKLLIKACRTFAYQEGFKEMRVPRAASLYSYHHPDIRPELLPDGRERALERIRKNMELIYDKNALDLGLVPDGNWFKWQNASSIRDYQPTILRRAIPAAASVALTAATTAILFQTHDSQAAPQGLVYFYLIPLVLIAIFSTARIAILSAGMALLCADYFLQDPIYSFYTSEYDDLILFAALAGLGIKAVQKLILRSNDRALMV